MSSDAETLLDVLRANWKATGNARMTAKQIVAELKWKEDQYNMAAIELRHIGKIDRPEHFVIELVEDGPKLLSYLVASNQPSYPIADLAAQMNWSFDHCLGVATDLQSEMPTYVVVTNDTVKLRPRRN